MKKFGIEKSSIKKMGVIVIAYNVEQYIAQCLESLLRQSYGNLEIVVVDDGSEDTTGEICDKMAGKDGRVNVVHQKNQGPIKARYHGLRQIHTEYVMFVDGDDWLELDTVETVMDTGLLGKVDMLTFGVVCNYDAQNRYYVMDNYEEGVYGREQIKEKMIPDVFWNLEAERHGIYPSLCAKVFRCRLLGRYFEDLCGLRFHYAEDGAIVYPVICSVDSLAVLHTCLYHYRLRGSNQVPEYVKDGEFFDKLALFYRYMRKKFAGIDGEEILVRQLDYFFIHSAKFRKWVYQDKVDNDKYLFPFGQVEKGSRVILYGAGSVGQTFYSQIRRSGYCILMGWVDRDYQKYGREEVVAVGNIHNMLYDYIVIAISSKEIVNAVGEYLVSMGVDAGKIVKYGEMDGVEQ